MRMMSWIASTVCICFVSGDFVVLLLLLCVFFVCHILVVGLNFCSKPGECVHICTRDKMCVRVYEPWEWCRRYRSPHEITAYTQSIHMVDQLILPPSKAPTLLLTGIAQVMLLISSLANQFTYSNNDLDLTNKYFTRLIIDFMQRHRFNCVAILSKIHFFLHALSESAKKSGTNKIVQWVRYEWMQAFKKPTITKK